MRKKTSKKLLNRSCAWIRDHWDATNLEVPEDFLEQWLFNQDDEEDEEPNGFYLAVFSFGALQYDLISNRVPTGVKRTFHLSLLLELFSKWQLKLALAQVHRVTDLRIRPMPLFGFPDGEQVEAWHVSEMSGSS
jgi:hypothetical protein